MDIDMEDFRQTAPMIEPHEPTPTSKSSPSSATITDVSELANPTQALSEVGVLGAQDT
jgi:hypothetical protein